MYLHLGQDSIIRTRDILGVFDLDTTTVSRHTRDFLTAAEKAGQVVNVTSELPKSFIVTVNTAKAPPPQSNAQAAAPAGETACTRKGLHPPQTVYISQISAATLKKRSGYIEDIRNI